MLIRGTLSFLILILASASLVAQQQGGTGGAGTSGGGAAPAPTTGQPSTGGRGGGGNRIPGGMDDPRNQSPINQPTQPIFISGRVMLDDGTPPPAQVVIERVCQMRTYREGYADSKGYFSLQLGANVGVFADASTDISSAGFGGPGFGAPGAGGAFGNTSASSRDLSQNQLSTCEIRASLPGYRSDTISLATRRALDRPDLGTIVLHNFKNVEGLTTSATTALAPKDARKAFDKGKKALESNKPDEAQKELLKAVELFPRYAEAWHQLGLVYERREHKPEAREAYGKALAADGKFVFPYERLYLMAAAEKNWDEVAETTDKVLRLNPFDFAGAYYFSAIANFELKKLDVAEKSAREASKLTGKRADPRSHYVLGVILAQKGEYTASSDSLKTFLKLVPAGTDTTRVEKMITEVDRMAAQGPAGAKP